MALTKVGKEGITGISNSSNATFLTVDTSEQAVIKSEGGAVTTSVQQGLAKHWAYFNMAGTSFSDSFNASSLTDNATGVFLVDIGLSVAITPSFSSSKVLIVYRVCTGIVSGGYGCALILVRGSTNIALGDQDGSNRTRVSSFAQSGNSGAAGYQVYYQAQDFLDSPSTTSATTYKLTARGWNSSPGSFYINRSATESDTASFTRPISTITAMEIAQ